MPELYNADNQKQDVPIVYKQDTPNRKKILLYSVLMGMMLLVLGFLFLYKSTIQNKIDPKIINTDSIQGKALISPPSTTDRNITSNNLPIPANNNNVRYAVTTYALAGTVNNVKEGTTSAQREVTVLAGNIQLPIFTVNTDVLTTNLGTGPVTIPVSALKPLDVILVMGVYDLKKNKWETVGINSANWNTSKVKK